MVGHTSFKNILVTGTALAALCGAVPAWAQTQTDESTQEAATPTNAETPVSDAEQTAGGKTSEDDRSAGIIVTGSRIRQDPNNSALPLQIVTTQEIQRNGISSPEQLIMFLSTNGSGADNLASNSDVTTGAQRGTNGLSAANLRGQGSGGTLVLLNGRRVAAHGLSGGAVDVNQIPFAAIERVEVLKDGASAIYGTDAVGGVINFITRKDYQGLGLTAFTDVTEGGGGSIYRLSGLAGYGDLDEQGFNIMGSVSYSWNQVLRGEDRDFVNGNQPERGLSIDTRGTPIATAFNIGANTQPGSITAGGTLLGTIPAGTTRPAGSLVLTAPNGANAVGGGINPLDLPGGAGCTSMDGGLAYDEQLWNTPAATYACAWDTGRAAVIQQPIKTLTYYARGVVNLGSSHQVSLEVTGSKADSAKRFSNAQLSANATNLPIAYPLTPTTAATYNSVFNAIRGAFPASAAALDARYGLPISYRWRCIVCGTREYNTESKTIRVAAGVEGPLFPGWDYRAGASYAKSEVSSVLGTGYYYRGTNSNGSYDVNAPAVAGAGLINGQTPRGLVGVMNSGLINPFSVSQSAEGLAALESVSAYGATLYGGQYEVKQLDGSVSGPLFDIWGGRSVQAAFGFDVRRETYSFNGSDAAAATAPVIFLAAFDNVNALTPKNRTVKAGYAEVLVPLLPGLEVTGAVRIDDYTGFGSTTNPKVSVKFRPIDQIMFRGSYNTGFRVPSFNQIFNGVTESPYAGSDLADPVRCPGGVPTSAVGSGEACAQIRPDIFSGGNRELGPETSKQLSAGVVIQPSPLFSASVDWWMINVDNTIQLLTLRELIDNASLFPTRFVRDPATNEVAIIDQRWINAGSRRTQGLEVTLRGGVETLGGRFGVGLDGTLLLKKREKLTADAEYGRSLIGVFSYAGDLGVKWKHNAFLSYSNDDVAISLSQIFRKGYRNGALPGIAAGTVTRPGYNAFVKDYMVYNLSAAYTGLAPGYKLVFGVRNLFDTDPPFAITYDGNSGAGGSWEPRIADPRGRSFTAGVEIKF